MEVVTTATPAAAAAKKSVGVGGAVRNQNKQGRQALRRDRMAPGGASVELQKYHQVSGRIGIILYVYYST